MRRHGWSSIRERDGDETKTRQGVDAVAHNYHSCSPESIPFAFEDRARQEESLKGCFRFSPFSPQAGSKRVTGAASSRFANNIHKRGKIDIKAKAGA
jgi:hypothetical protein